MQNDYECLNNYENKLVIHQNFHCNLNIFDTSSVCLIKNIHSKKAIQYIDSQKVYYHFIDFLKMLLNMRRI